MLTSLPCYLWWHLSPALKSVCLFRGVTKEGTVPLVSFAIPGTVLELEITGFWILY